MTNFARAQKRRSHACAACGIFRVLLLLAAGLALTSGLALAGTFATSGASSDASAIAPVTPASSGNRPASAPEEEMLGQMLMLGFRGYGEDDAEQAAGFRKILDLIGAGKLGGVILFNRDQTGKTFERNIRSPEQLRRLCAVLQSAAPAPLFIAVDQEGGRVRRLTPGQGFMDLPPPAEMGKMNETEVRGLGLDLGRELRGLGINLNFAPSLDLNVNPDNPVIGALGRSFGRDAELVAAKGKAFMQGLNEAGILGCYKHFPGHGSSRGDSHLEFTDISATWEDAELTPYRKLLDNDGPYMVMLGHLFHSGLDPKYPASLSRGVATGLLRGELGWQGVIISDDLQMRAIADHYSLEETLRLALNAGNDILLFGNNLNYDPELPEKVHQALLKLYRDGKLDPERIRQSHQRIMRLKARLPA